MDCSAVACSVAVGDSGGLLAYQCREMIRGHAAALAPMTKQVMASAGVSFSNLSAVAATVGPGSFTGIRIGLAMARGIGLAAEVPVIGVTSFEAVAAACQAEKVGPLLVVLETKRPDLYLQAFTASGAEACEPMVLDPTDIPAFIETAFAGGDFQLAGDGAARLVSAGPLGNPGARPWTELGDPLHPGPPEAKWVLEAARSCLANTDSLRPPRPMYLRAPDVGPGF
jgi:tRNA threonylcarbamoyladenosine biosynthesis protein TsaB